MENVKVKTNTQLNGALFGMMFLLQFLANLLVGGAFLSLLAILVAFAERGGAPAPYMVATITLGVLLIISVFVVVFGMGYYLALKRLDFDRSLKIFKKRIVWIFVLMNYTVSGVSLLFSLIDPELRLLKLGSMVLIVISACAFSFALLQGVKFYVKNAAKENA